MKRLCSVDGCGKTMQAKGLCPMHYHRLRKNGEVGSAKPLVAEFGNAKSNASNGYIWASYGKMEHVAIAEKAIGKELPHGAEVHHIDGDKSNNANSNLVICQDRKYHMLLHRRQTALDECGHAGWMMCGYCKKYDDPKNMSIRGTRARHRSCHAKYELERKKNAIGKAHNSTVTVQG